MWPHHLGCQSELLCHLLVPSDAVFVPQAGSQQQASAAVQPLVSEDDRYGSVYIQGRGTVVTYMFQVVSHTQLCLSWFSWFLSA